MKCNVVYYSKELDVTLPEGFCKATIKFNFEYQISSKSTIKECVFKTVYATPLIAKRLGYCVKNKLDVDIETLTVKLDTNKTIEIITCLKTTK